MPFYWRREAEPVKQIFATIKSTIDTDNSSNTVLLFLFLWNSPNVYTLVWKHTNKWRNVKISAKKKLRVASKMAFVTVKSTIDTSNSSNTVLLFLNLHYMTLNTLYWHIFNDYLFSFQNLITVMVYSKRQNSAFKIPFLWKYY
jgi:hypothetical protein